MNLSYFSVRSSTGKLSSIQVLILEQLSHMYGPFLITVFALVEVISFMIQFPEVIADQLKQNCILMYNMGLVKLNFLLLINMKYFSLEWWRGSK